ncbi:GMC oxidoreductase [Neolentinus lepideus HHB14362 ss-1]|uniref:GMC oxidoreductase n=1 Tax=Neolentinus lepideus HHB14362 ss-1 TaxID=1314782 RepID=A0A165QV26_9AGAM|nr:GMC oxidoreductase [Neolentinus lepideus HHB14362 ss-1]
MSANPRVYSAHHSAFVKTKFGEDGASTPEFDFIVVGGGPAGCALGTRLAENPAGYSVLLVEQGTTVEQNPELQNLIRLPLLTRSLHGSSFDVQYPTIGENQFAHRELKINSGKVLGGSTCINWAIWTRGPKDDYDLWARLTGNQEFSWDAMLPTFDRIERQTAERSEGRISIRSSCQSPRDNYWSSTAALSLEQAGLQRLENINDGAMLGYGELVENVSAGGERATANDYLKQTSAAGLEVWTAVRVEKVLFEDATEDGKKRAVCVSTHVGTVRARKEIILCAGAVQSPHILLLSGIGPQSQLESYRIPVIHNLPEVGQNLWEHPVVDIRFKLRPEKRRDTAEDLASIRTAGRHLDKWANEGQGLISGIPVEWFTFTNLKEKIEPSLSQDPSTTEYEKTTLLRTAIPHVEQFLHYGHGLAAAPDPFQSSYISMSNVVLTPRSPDPINPRIPRIEVNQLKEEVDREMMIAVVEKAYDVLSSKAWEDFLEPQEKPDRETVLDIIKERLTTLWHLGGTCAMETSYNTGVVDSSFRVHGVQGLRVADTSIIPFPISAHTQAVAYAIGEKAAVFIGQDHL